MQALRTRSRFIYCAPTPLEYCAGPLFVGGCIVTVQCTIWRAGSSVRERWTKKNLRTFILKSWIRYKCLLPTRYEPVHISPTARRPSTASLTNNAVTPIAQLTVITPAYHDTHLANFSNCPVAFTDFVNSVLSIFKHHKSGGLQAENFKNPHSSVTETNGTQQGLTANI